MTKELIRAAEYLKISKKSLQEIEDHRLKVLVPEQLDLLIYEIRISAEKGFQGVHTSILIYDENVKTLENLGYRVERGRNMLNSYCSTYIYFYEKEPTIWQKIKNIWQGRMSHDS